MLFFKPAFLLAPLTAISFAALVAESSTEVLLERADVPIKKKIKALPAGQCSILLYSATILPVGGVSTLVSGENFAPSQVGSEEAVVIDHNKKIVGGPVNLAHVSPGFAADFNVTVTGKLIAVRAS